MAMATAHRLRRGRRTQWWAGMVAAVLISAGFWPMPGMAVQTVAGTVVEVTDGRSLRLALDGGWATVRLADIVPTGSPEDARRTLQSLTLGRPAWVMVTGRDRGGVLLGKAYVEGRNIAEELMRLGSARPAQRL